MNKTWKLILVGLVWCGWRALAADPEAKPPALIPWPQHVEFQPGNFRITRDTVICAAGGALPIAQQLADELRPAMGFELEVRDKAAETNADLRTITLTMDDADAPLGAEGYALTVATNAVVARAATAAGLFYAAVTLRQLLPTEIFSTNVIGGKDWKVRCATIKDWPRFPWRGLMLDVSRHFYNKDEVERVLDLMALYKLNTFHWHLVDSQGWRLEIKKYPLLTQVGAWRQREDLTAANFHGTNSHPAWAKVAASKFGTNGMYGGYYTQDDVREIVAYAAARHITIVPEIELPGHSGAALAAYPEFGGPEAHNSTDAPIGVRSLGFGVYNPANPGTFEFLDNVLAEVFELFPGKYVHIGGDEVSKRYWTNDPDCQALMQREHLASGEELQSWFIKRIEQYVDAHGKTLVGWSEILQGGLAQNAVLMDWIGGAVKGASMGHDVVMTPNSHCYLNYYQSTNRAEEPRAQGDFLPLKKVYSFEPVPAKLPERFHHHILGAQGNLWTEWVATLPHVEYMLFPRLTALAEVDWSAKNARNWEFFQTRLKDDEQRLDLLDVNYRKEKTE